MKTFKLLAIGSLVGALFLTSCSNQRFAHLKKVKVNQTEIVKANSKAENITHKNTNLEVNSTIAPVEQKAIALNAKVETTGEKIAPVKEILTVQKLHNSKASVEPKTAKKIKKLEKLLNHQAASPKGSDSNTLILVILSLFPILALIAIYLKDGKTITTNFWVDLILHLTYIGAIVFAILVVLDIVNLA